MRGPTGFVASTATTSDALNGEVYNFGDLRREFGVRRRELFVEREEHRPFHRRNIQMDAAAVLAIPHECFGDIAEAMARRHATAAAS
jgi:hypothetical protein